MICTEGLTSSTFFPPILEYFERTSDRIWNTESGLVFGNKTYTIFIFTN